MKRLHFAHLFVAFCALAAVAVGALLGGAAAVFAQAEQDSPGATADDASAADDLERLLTIPDGTPEQIIEHLSKLAGATPGDREPAEAREFLTRVSRAMIEGADKLIALKPAEKQVAVAYQVKLISLQRLARLGDAEAAKQLATLIKRVRRDPREQVAAAGWQLFIMNHLQTWQALDKADKQAFLDEIIADIKEVGPSALHVDLIQVVAQQMERVDPDFTRDLLNRAVPLFKASPNEAIASAAEFMEGTARRLNLPGNEMKLQGTPLGGGKFDWDAYRGKVVLVDFWATWCGPCRQELPNVLAMYEKYHDRGFDVVGISLDSSKEGVEGFVEERGIPWTQLFPEDPEQREWNNPIARYYGVSGIPTAILVGRDGKVVEMNARDHLLRAKLRDLLGEPDEEAAE